MGDKAFNDIKGLRLALFDKVAKQVVLMSMGEARKAKLKRCDICPEIIQEGTTCQVEDDCSKYGFEEMHSIVSATKAISHILAGRN